MEEKIRLIWDFRGPDCEKIAKHYKIHLSDFLNTNNSIYFDFNDRKITTNHHIVYLMMKLYPKETSSIQKQPKNETIQFLINFSKSLRIVETKSKDFIELNLN